MADDEWRIRAARGAKLLPDDPNGLRRRYIAELLKRSPAASGGLDALGGVDIDPPPIDPDIWRKVMSSVSTSKVDEIAGMTSANFIARAAPGRDVMTHNRTVVWWLLYDAYRRAQVAPDLIKIELRLRANAARAGGELAQLSRVGGTLLKLFEQAHGVADEAEPILGLALKVRPPVSPGTLGALRDYGLLFRPEATPTWNHSLGIACQPGDVAIDNSGTLEKAGRHSALGALAVIIPALLGRRRGVDRVIAEAATRLFGTVVDAKEVGYRRSVSLEQRGFSPAPSGPKPGPKRSR